MPFRPFKFLKKLVKTVLVLFLLLGLLAAFTFGAVFHQDLYNRFVYFPKVQTAWEQIRAQIAPVTLDDGWTEFRGVCHSHSALSHDSEIVFDDILVAAKTAQLNFMMMSDHCTDGVGDYSLQWRGLHDGILFVPGFETSNGLLVWGLPAEEKIDCALEVPELVASVHSRGGAVFFAHTEEERPYEVEGVSGMEIYNIHTDLKDEKATTLLGNILLNSRKFPDESLYAIYDPQESILSLWDRLNTVGDWTGIAANDAHQNVGVIARWGEDSSVFLTNTANDPIASFKAPAWLVNWVFGGQPLFRVDFDPYLRSLRFVNTHILARELTEIALLESLREGRVFIGFDMIADSTGFVFFAEQGGQKAVMGESIPFAPGIALKTAAPTTCRLRLYRDGTLIEETEGNSATWTPKEAGKYRVSADLKVAGEWMPWIIANPIALDDAGDAAPAS